MRLSVVLPCYKEGRKIEQSVLQLLEIADSTPEIGECQVIIVVEKSAANTLEVALELQANDPRIHVLPNDRCYGKGYSVRRGILYSRGDLILVNDADLPVDLDRYFPLMMNLMAGEYVGSVYLTAFGDKTDSRKRGFFRAELTNALFSLRRWFLKHNISDTQLGCKLYHGDLARSLMSMVDEPGFLYELQMTDLIAWSGFAIEECAARINRFSRESSVSLRTVARNLVTFLKYTLYKRRRLFERQMSGHLISSFNSKPGGFL